jgi:hypothetical protein
MRTVVVAALGLFACAARETGSGLGSDAGPDDPALKFVGVFHGMFGGGFREIHPENTSQLFTYEPQPNEVSISSSDTGRIVLRTSDGYIEENATVSSDGLVSFDRVGEVIDTATGDCPSSTTLSAATLAFFGSQLRASFDRDTTYGSGVGRACLDQLTGRDRSNTVYRTTLLFFAN